MSELPENSINAAEQSIIELMKQRYAVAALSCHEYYKEIKACEDFLFDMYEQLSPAAKIEARKMYNFDFRLLDWLEEFEEYIPRWQRHE